MGDLVAKVRHQVADDLESDEQVLAALRGNARGGVAQAMLGGIGLAGAGTIGYVAGQTIGDELDQRAGTDDRAAAARAGVDLAAGTPVTVVGTARRVLVYRNSITGKAKALLGVIPRAEITGVSLDDGRTLGAKVPVVVLETRSGGTVQVQVGKVQRTDAQRFVGAMNHAAAA